MLTLLQKINVIHRAWRYRLKTEPQEIALVRDLIRPGDTVLDIGAHKGAFSYWMGKSVGPTGKVLAFEPIPELIDYLTDVAEWLDTNIDVLGYALSNQEGPQKLYFPGFHMGGASLESSSTVFQDPVVVTKRIADKLLKPGRGSRPVSLIKCDVEGHELAVLEGAKEILETDRPILLFESGNLVNGDVVNGPVFRFLESMGFEGYFLNERRLVSVSDFDSEIHFIDQSAYQNFVFVHPTALNWESKVRPYKVNRSEITSTGFQGDSRAVN